jgi:7-cyano-7-deazaguanine reductase
MSEAEEDTQRALAYMAQFGIRPEGRIRLFYGPEHRQTSIDRIPFRYPERQVVIYETEPGEFTAVCPYSGLPDSGRVYIEYVPGSYLLELKSLKYYLISWREIGILQEDLTALLYEDLLRHLEDPEYLKVTTFYNVRGGIRTTCTIDSREQARPRTAPPTAWSEPGSPEPDPR